MTLTAKDRLDRLKKQWFDEIDSPHATTRSITEARRRYDTAIRKYM